MSIIGGYKPSSMFSPPDKSHLILVAFRFCKSFIFFKTIQKQINNILLH